ncbi:MAG: 3-hydroxyacyl-CoA dehydrogenase NAD-binding domain-containing protein [Candidatus Bathyarchaeota archaeon]|uniref:UDP binding domain-containing protein n=1 Tax=Candidatus Bathycorpusculum sp. TaxID=2994959 RepID=UPI00281E7DA9|nr:3-hydroxyacyl-CoA dehydrogenase NAD-binding domain-containing protein [Candidatus Termiticorpusculum sp.]MCL2257797.1 3-hydroxyacyl-CoA dehydrogenase NAD-binding domain-containing protein [Candidatus Termiticorpusculum sp.]
MPSVLNLQVQDVDSEEKRAQYTVSIVGCGRIGMLYADAFAEAGYKVTCNDENPNLIKRLTKAKNCCITPEIEERLKKHIDTGNLTTSNVRKSTVAQSDIIILAINIRIDTKNKSDTLELEGAYKQVGTALKQGSLLIYGGSGGFGSTETLLKETLENTSGLKEGKDFLVAYSPLYLPKTMPIKTLKDTDLIIASSNQQSLGVATIILETLTTKVKQANQVKLAELATLFKAVQQDTCTALANELAIFCENTGMDYFKVQKLISDEKSNFFPAIEEEENRKETYLLIESAENLNIKLRLPQLSRQINEERVKHAINLTQKVLRSCGKSLRRAKVAVLGTPNQNTTTSKYIETATAKGAKVALYDPLLVKNETPDTMPVLKKSLSETVEGADCLVILTGQEQFKRLNLKRLKTVMKKPAVLVDLIGIAELEKVQAEGFIYCGIGRGMDKP